MTNEASDAAADAKRPGETRLVVEAGPYLVELTVPDDLAGSMTSTLRDLLVDAVDAPERARVEVDRLHTSEYGKPLYRVVAGPFDEVQDSGIEAEHVAGYVVRLLLFGALEVAVDRLHLHAGLVVSGGRGILLAGQSGAGKTTLTTHLTRSGFEYVTDERVAVHPSTLAASGFPKPVALKPGSFDLFTELDPRITGVGQATEAHWHVPASMAGPIYEGDAVAVHAIVFVNHAPGAALTLEEVHPASAAALLLSDSPDVARFGGGALEVAGRIAASARCIRLTYSNLEAAADEMRRLLSSSNFGDPDDVLVLPFVNGALLDTPIEPSDVLVRVGSSPSVVVGGRMLLMNQDLDVIECDEPTSAWLTLLDGQATVAELADLAGDVANAGSVDRHADILAAGLRLLDTMARTGLIGRPT